MTTPINPIKLKIDATIILKYFRQRFERYGVPRYDPVQLLQFIDRKVYAAKQGKEGGIYGKGKAVTVDSRIVDRWLKEFLEELNSYEVKHYSVLQFN